MGVACKWSIYLTIVKGNIVLRESWLVFAYVLLKYEKKTLQLHEKKAVGDTTATGSLPLETCFVLFLYYIQLSYTHFFIVITYYFNNITSVTLCAVVRLYQHMNLNHNL